MTVYFHGSFGLNREYMAGVLATSLRNPTASGDEIAAPFGYKAPFTGRYKSWLHKTGLTTKGRKLQLTPMGEIVWKFDRKFESPVTQWFMHHELCTDPARAEAWHYFAYEFLPKCASFSISELERGLAMKLMSHHPTHFGRDAPMIKVIARKIVQCYTEDTALGALRILTKENAKLYKVGGKEPRGPWGTTLQLEDAYSSS